jgi:hypothetical protein
MPVAELEEMRDSLSRLIAAATHAG